MAVMPLATLCALLAGCGGGGGVASTPTPVAGATPTPAPTNTSLANLTYSQTFATAGASVTTAIDTGNKLVTGASTTARGTVQVSYDAASRSYTIQAPGRTQSFAPGDIQAGTNPGETRYFKTDGATRDYLTLAVTPYTSSTPNRYVGLGYWQRNMGGAGAQNTTFDSFVYGFDTPASAVPRTGNASYRTDTLGFVTTPNVAPRAFTGSGSFNVDFALGVFAAKTSVTEYDLTSSASVSGGGIEFVAGGHLSSGNGFSGNFTYGGQNTRVSGTLGGQFFGPGAEELGATFAADDGKGSAVTGSLTGESTGANTAQNLALTDVVTDQLYYASEATLATRAAGGAPRGPNVGTGIGQLYTHPDGSFSLTAASSEFAASRFAASDRVADDRANFTSYEKVVDGRTLRVSFYKPGPANTDLALTYAGFGMSVGGAASSYDQFDGRYYFAYGIDTPSSLLARRTGTASYNGVAYGSGGRVDGASFDIRGTSHFDVDFSNQRYTGSLTLNGTSASVPGTTDFSTWTFGSNLSYGQMYQTALTRAGQAANVFNTITPRFYGPDGEEIAGSFALQTGASSAAGTVSIVGATVAKRQ